MAEHKIRIAKRDFPLAFTLGAMERMEKTMPGFDITKIDEILSSVTGKLDIIYILAQEGASVEGKELDVSRSWIGSHIPANRDAIVRIHTAIVETLVDGMSMETDDEDEDREVDVVLEEIKKKDVKTA